ncbi:hypothetical protein [Bordetella petrii]|uniref:hypothetical protein n=1 Tax=Bordetella petrii TaxID=94624 RepID=UPI001E427DE6|nr:hypothetical protein [Bordetella petrii]MCD0505280.1 hypothetical protein [Bordetella petrii]
MAKRSPSIDRAVRIELLRARAAIERESLAHSIASTGRSLAPGNLLKRWLPGLGGGGNLSNLLWQGVSLARRYPFISSTVSALIMGRGKRSRLFRVAGGVLLGWQAFKAWRGMRESGPEQGAAQGRAPDSGGQASRTPTPPLP